MDFISTSRGSLKLGKWFMNAWLCLCLAGCSRLPGNNEKRLTQPSHSKENNYARHAFIYLYLFLVHVRSVKELRKLQRLYCSVPKCLGMWRMTHKMNAVISHTYTKMRIEKHLELQQHSYYNYMDLKESGTVAMACDIKIYGHGRHRPSSSY